MFIFVCILYYRGSSNYLKHLKHLKYSTSRLTGLLFYNPIREIHQADIFSYRLDRFVIFAALTAFIVLIVLVLFAFKFFSF